MYSWSSLCSIYNAISSSALYSSRAVSGVAVSGCSVTSGTAVDSGSKVGSGVSTGSAVASGCSSSAGIPSCSSSVGTGVFSGTGSSGRTSGSCVAGGSSATSSLLLSFSLSVGSSWSSFSNWSSSNSVSTDVLSSGSIASAAAGIARLNAIDIASAKARILFFIPSHSKRVFSAEQLFSLKTKPSLNQATHNKKQRTASRPETFTLRCLRLPFGNRCFCREYAVPNFMIHLVLLLVYHLSAAHSIIYVFVVYWFLLLTLFNHSMVYHIVLLKHLFMSPYFLPSIFINPPSVRSSAAKPIPNTTTAASSMQSMEFSRCKA